MTAIPAAPQRLFPRFESMMTEESARAILTLRVTPEMQERFHVVADQCREGELNEEELRQYKEFVDEIGSISLLQAQARSVLRKLGKL
ncbi:hypothetical protein [Prosthecobacter sp.]|uniref:hypothetical protein n=1 Tax=Prosthecobacter sp. TaxID=1965333 RepID=UPI0039049CA3